MTITTIKLGGYFPLALLIASVLSGCGGEGSNGENVGASNNKQPNPQATVAPADATFSTGFSEHYLVDLSSKVYSSDGSGFVLTDVEVLSDNVNCQVDSMSDSGFVIDASASKACNYRYFVSPKAQGAMSQAAHEPTPMSAQSYSDSAPSSAVARVAVSSAPGDAIIETVISNVTLINTDVDTDLEKELASVGVTLGPGFVLTDISLPYGYASSANAASGNDHVIEYSPAPGFTGIDRILYTYEDTANDLVLMGVLDIAVAYEANEGFSIDDNIEYPNKVEVNTPTEIDMSDFIISDDGDDYQLVYVESFNATAIPKDPIDTSNKVIIFEASQSGYHYVSFAVSDHNGAYDMGLMRIDVFDPDQSAKWDGINFQLDYFLASPTSVDSLNDGIAYDTKVLDSYYTPAIGMASFNVPSAVDYCDTVGATLPTIEQLQQMKMAENPQVLHNWPVQLNYLAYDVAASNYEWFQLADGATGSGPVLAGETYYVTCVKQGVMNILPSSDTEAVANGIDIGNVFVQLKLGSEIRPNVAIEASVSGTSAILESDTVTTDINGIAEFKLTSFKAEIVTLTLDIDGITEDYQIAFIADETTAAVTSEVTVNNASYNSVEGNQVTATLTDQNNNVIEGYSVGFDVSTENHPDTGFAVTPLLVEESAQTDEFGEQKVRVTWDPQYQTPKTNMTFNVTSSYTTTDGMPSDSTSQVTFNGYVCGGQVGDDDKANAAGDCIKIAESNGKLYTGSPSVSFLQAIGYGGYSGTITESGTRGPSGGVFARLNHIQSVELCTQYNNIKLNGKSNWRLATKNELASLYDNYGDMFNVKGWATYYSYWSSTPIGSSYFNVYLSHGRVGSGYHPSDQYYASCVSGS
ncbi:DUF1566 domain-containing protein [Vibrio lentus]